MPNPPTSRAFRNLGLISSTSWMLPSRVNYLDDITSIDVQVITFISRCYFHHWRKVSWNEEDFKVFLPALDYIFSWSQQQFIATIDSVSWKMIFPFWVMWRFARITLGQPKRLPTLPHWPVICLWSSTRQPSSTGLLRFAGFLYLWCLPSGFRVTVTLLPHAAASALNVPSHRWGEILWTRSCGRHSQHTLMTWLATPQLSGILIQLKRW